MKFEIEPQDIEAIAQRTFELLKPFLLPAKRGVEDEILDVKGLSEYLRVDPSWIYKQVSLKAIPHFKSGKYVRFKKSSIDKWIENRSVRPMPKG